MPRGNVAINREIVKEVKDGIAYLEKLNTSATLFQVLTRLNTSSTVVKFQCKKE